MHIALLEDEREQARNVQALLSEKGYACDIYNTGQSFLSAVTHKSFDLLILDWQVPDIDGIEVLETVRRQLDWPIPVLFLTQRDSEEDIVRALDAGADDYLPKPARPSELIARIRALARRSNPDSEKETLTFGPFRIDTQTREISLRGDVLVLTDKDFDLAVYLFRNQGRLLTRDLLLERVWGVSREINTRTVDTHMSRLRRRLGIKPENGYRIKTIYQRGYRLEAVDGNGELQPPS